MLKYAGGTVQRRLKNRMRREHSFKLKPKASVPTIPVIMLQKSSESRFEMLMVENIRE